MTIEILKANREEIIAIIERYGEDTKRIMGLMVKMIGYRGYEGMSVSEFTKATIKDNPTTLTITDSTTYYANERLKQLPSSMR